MKRKRFFLVVFALAASLISGSASGSSDISCQHYWKVNGTEVPTKKEVGVDVGESEKYSEGVYHCQVDLTREDVEGGKYIFIGEVGDASYVELTAYDGHVVSRAPITHGLNPNDLAHTRYMRIIPFLFSARDIFIDSGKHEFSIYYKDIVPGQIGIRSGPPVLLTFGDAISRSLAISKTLIFHLVQIVYLICCTLWFMFWPSISWRRRAVLGAAAAASAFSIVQLTAIPRMFDPKLAVQLNDLIQLATYPLLLSGFSLFYKPTKRTNTFKYLLSLHALLTLSGIVTVALWPKTSHSYFFVFGSFCALLIVVPVLWCAVSIARSSVLPVFQRDKSKFVIFALTALGAMLLFDYCNLVLLGSRYLYFNHYILFSGFIGLLQYMLMSEAPNGSRFLEGLELIKNETFGILSKTTSNDYDVLKGLAQSLGDLIGSKRLSLAEITPSGLKFIGLYGNYRNPQGIQIIGQRSFVERALALQEVVIGDARDKDTQSINLEYAVIPLSNREKVIGVLCTTDFKYGCIAPFIKARFSIIQQEAAVLLSILLNQRRLRAQSELLQLMRHRTHELQLKSEEFFLHHFDLSQTLSEHVFICGDLVGSVGLNERYQAGPHRGAVQAAIDSHLSNIWERFKELGIILTREKGDAISIIIPNQSQDVSTDEAVGRALEIVAYLSKCGDEFQELSKKCGIVMRTEYVFVMSKLSAKIQHENGTSIRPFTLLVDEAIDGASRVMKSGLPGDCLLMEAVMPHVPNNVGTVELSPERIRGKDRSIRIFRLLSSSQSGAA